MDVWNANNIRGCTNLIAEIINKLEYTKNRQKN